MATTAPDTALTFNPFDPAFGEDPYPFYRRLRAGAPIGTVPGLDVWYLTRYDDCDAVLRNPAAGSEASKSPVYQRMIEAGLLRLPQSITGRPSFAFRDPPDHTRLRKLVSSAFTPRVVDRMRPRIQELTDALLDRAAGTGEIELVREFAYPLVFTVMSELIGVPAEDQPKFLAWSDEMSASMDPRISPPAEVVERQERAMRENRDYLVGLIDRRRREPRSDLLSALIQAEEGGGRLTEDEVLSTAILLVGAGTETTVHLIGNAILALLTHPDQLAILRQQPELIERAVEELLRWDPPTQLTQRIALADLTFGDVTVPEGCPIMVSLGAANRDEARWPDGEQFDITRPERSHLAYGFGIHFCLGASLARAEGHIAISTIVRRFPDLALLASRRRATFVLRCLDELRLKV
jgi:pimeloyl-[acyl-carrier protein] synthase